MDYSLDMAYNSYLLESMLEQSKMETYIQEALILSEGVNMTGKLTSLNEGVGGKLKEVWQKFTDFIKRIFAKFTETMTKVLDTDKGWLEKYQNIVLKKPFKLDVSCREYKLDRIIQHQIPIFNYSQLKDRLESKSVFMKSIINEFPANDNGDDLTGWCKAYFCNGREEETKMVNANMKDLYDYCHDFKDTTLPKLRQYQSNIEKSAVNANSLITQAINNSQGQTQSNNNQTQSSNNQAQSTSQQPQSTGTTSSGKIVDANGNPITAKKESFDIFAETTPYSRLFNKPLTELTINNAPGTTNNQTKAPEGNPDKKLSANVPDGKNTAGGETQDTARAAVDNDAGLTEEKISNIIGTYTSVAGAITSSAITVAQWAYVDYMKILRAHVQMYVSDSDTPNQAAQAGTDYRPKDQQQQTQNTQPNQTK